MHLLHEPAACTYYMGGHHEAVELQLVRKEGTRGQLPILGIETPTRAVLPHQDALVAMAGNKTGARGW